jgi:hypothetical protein
VRPHEGAGGCAACDSASDTALVKRAQVPKQVSPATSGIEITVYPRQMIWPSPPAGEMEEEEGKEGLAIDERAVLESRFDHDFGVCVCVRACVCVCV